MEENIYNFTALSIKGDEVPLSVYRDKMLLIVNTASKCGFTSQYGWLQKIYDEYKDRGFVVLGFPCNQFGSQEPGDEESIGSFCRMNFGITFPMFSKIDVKGDNASPLYKYLIQVKGGLFGSNIKWNFTKFLIDVTGVPIKRYAPATDPKKIAVDIERLLA